jgi:hypothetical protein
MERSLPPSATERNRSMTPEPTMTRTSLFCLLAAAGIAVGACGRDERTARQELSTSAREDPGYGTDAPATVVPVPDTTAAGGQTLTGNLAEMNNSGTRGVVTVTPRDGQTLIQLSVTGAQPNTSLMPTVHRGRCDEVGQLVHQLERIQVEGSGRVGANITLNQPVQAIADGQHSVRIYPEAGYQTPPISCAELPTTAGTTRM